MSAYLPIAFYSCACLLKIHSLKESILAKSALDLQRCLLYLAISLKILQICKQICLFKRCINQIVKSSMPNEKPIVRDILSVT